MINHGTFIPLYHCTIQYRQVTDMELAYLNNMIKPGMVMIKMASTDDPEALYKKTFDEVIPNFLNKIDLFLNSPGKFLFGD